MISIIGRPQRLAPAYNNMYVYATSSLISEPGFRYVVTTAQFPDNNSYEILNTDTILPRYGDDYLETNVNKILQSKISNLTTDVDFNNNGNRIFYNTPSSGIVYAVYVSEQYIYSWDFTGTTQSGLYVGMVSDVEPEYASGDVIYVNGLATYLTYTSITNNGIWAQLNTTNNNLLVGDVVSISQNSPFTYPQYNGTFTVLISDPGYVVINVLYAGVSSFLQTGTIVHNGFYDGTAIVLQTSGTYPEWVTLIDKEINALGTFSVSATASGTTRYNNSDKIINSGIITKLSTAWNGAMNRSAWATYDYTYLSPITPNFLLLTDLFFDLRVKTDNDIYLDYFAAGLSYSVQNLILETNSGGVINTYIIPYDGVGTQSAIQSINVGPKAFNDCQDYVLDINGGFDCTEVITNGDFATTSGWNISNYLGGTASIGSGVLNYYDSAGDGTSDIVQTGVLTPGHQYSVTITAANNNFAQVLVGDESTSYQILNDANGTFTYTFTATGSDFWITINSVFAGECGVDLDSLEVCDYGWIISNYLGGTASISGGILNYYDNAGGDGTSDIVYANVLIPGNEYTVSLVSSNNNYTQVMVGDENDTYQILNDANGTFTYTFTATGNDFWITTNSTNPFECGVDITDITISYTQCDLMQCDSGIDSYSIHLELEGRDNNSVIYSLGFGDAAYNIYNANNAYTSIIDSIITYTDLVEFGGIGASLITQDEAFNVFDNYTATIHISNNQECLVQFGNTGLLYPVGVTGSTGTFSITFNASDPTLLLTISGTSLFTNGCTIDYLSVINNTVYNTVSGTYNFILDCECEGRYTNYPIIFMDRKGSFLTYNFDLNNKQTVGIDRKDFDTFVGGYNAGSINGYDYQLNDAGTKVFSTFLNEEWELNSDAMTEAESIFFEELMTSPVVSIKIDGEYLPIIIKGTTYERIRKNNKKMIYYKLAIKFANNNPIQSL
jgi:hypothetical protein